MSGHRGRVGSGWVAGVAGLLALVLLAAVGVAVVRTDTAGADTVLTAGDDARLELADGSVQPVAVGDLVPRGATVLAGRTGAVLQTREREVHLGGATRVTVLDGARQVLRSGFVLVDASEDAPGVELATAAATVTTRDDSLVRVDAATPVRVGVLRGEAAAVRAAGRRATSAVPTYFQVQVAPGGLPGATTPFVLTPGDAYERDLAAELVTADEDLNALASRLDGDGRAGRVVLAALSTEVQPAPALAPGAPGSEGTLGYLIATAASGREDVSSRYLRVRELRSAGGSWGIVAAIVEAEVGRVGAALGALLEPGIVPVLAAGPLDADALLDVPSGRPLTQEPVAPAPPAGPRPAPPRGPGGGGGAPTPTASPTPGPTDPVGDVVEQVVDAVLDLISPSPAPPVQVPLQVPLIAPSPLGTVTLHLGG